MGLRRTIQIWAVGLVLGFRGLASAGEAGGGTLPERVAERVGQWPEASVSTVAVDRVSMTNEGCSYSWPDTPVDSTAQDVASVAVPGSVQVLSFHPPVNMTLVTAGPYTMGNGFSGEIGAYTVDQESHVVHVQSIYMDRFEVTGALWKEVADWAKDNGYPDLCAGSEGFATSGAADDRSLHPIVDVTWHDCVKWCNARSESEGLMPVYFTDAAQVDVYRAGSCALRSENVDWKANGYRLPTEAEWEKAAQGNREDQLFPWGDRIDGSCANYWNSGDPFDNGTTPVGYYNGRQKIKGFTKVKDMMNDYALYDMNGNVYEWCWDRHGHVGTNAVDNPVGPDVGDFRTLRGGCWKSMFEASLRCTYRNHLRPEASAPYVGFRCVRKVN